MPVYGKKSVCRGHKCSKGLTVESGICVCVPIFFYELCEAFLGYDSIIIWSFVFAVFESLVKCLWISSHDISLWLHVVTTLCCADVGPACSLTEIV